MRWLTRFLLVGLLCVTTSGAIELNVPERCTSEEAASAAGDGAGGGGDLERVVPRRPDRPVRHRGAGAATLVTSTLFTLFVLPVFYLQVHRRLRARYEAAERAPRPAHEPRVLERLSRTPRSRVPVSDGLDQGDPFAQLRGQRLWRVPLHGQSAAPLWPVSSKRGDDGGASALERGEETVLVPLAIRGIDQEVEHGAVMPDVYRIERPLAGDIDREPSDVCAGVTQPPLAPLEGSLRDIENGQARKASPHQGVDQSRIAAADVQHATLGCRAGRFQHRERNLGQRLEPAHLLLPLRPVDGLPVLLPFHAACPFRVTERASNGSSNTPRTPCLGQRVRRSPRAGRFR
jgi:hypothetical protein